MIRQTPTPKKKIWRWILLVLIMFFLFIWLWWSFKIDQTIIIRQWDTLSKFTKDLSKINQLKLKWYIKRNNIDLDTIKQWSYVFSGSYRSKDFVEKILQWPTKNFVSYTVLEWWSIYDIDASLTKKWFINQWEYISFVSDNEIVNKYKLRYPFLNDINLKNLEWFLYPDTYHIDGNNNFVDQLVYLQLDAFKKKVWDKYDADFVSFEWRLTINWIKLPFPVTTYNIISLASIVEKEEKNNNNKATVAGIFIKRLWIWMRLDADITLCYGLGQAYDVCTPSVIAKNIKDDKNLFNTRARPWITPQPISNPNIKTIEAVLKFKASEYLYYLHDNNGKIHYAKTLAEHNQNKSKYINN